MIDTFEGARAAEAANLSIAQWKVVPVVLLAALGLVGSGSGGVDDTGALVPDGVGAIGAEACVQLCGTEAALSSREFEMLMEMLLFLLTTGGGILQVLLFVMMQMATVCGALMVRLLS